MVEPTSEADVTLGLAWRQSDFVLMVADSMVSGVTDITHEFSSFGEAHADLDDGTFVHQGALKLYVAGSTRTFAGPARKGIEVVRIAKAMIETQAADPREAMTSALNSVGPPAEGESLTFLAGYSTPESAVVTRWRDGGSMTLSDGPEIIGSVPAEYRQRIACIVEAIRGTDAHPMDSLVMVLGLLHSYGERADLVASGVGGHYSGAMVGPGGNSAWQPDVLFMFYNGREQSETVKCISSAMRGGVHIIGSSRTRDTRIFSTLSSDEMTAWRENWDQDSTGCGNPAPAYVVFIDRSSWRVVVVNMAFSRSHPDVHLDGYELFGTDAPSSDQRQAVEMGLSPQISEMLFGALESDTLFSLQFVPSSGLRGTPSDA